MNIYDYWRKLIFSDLYYIFIYKSFGYTYQMNNFELRSANKGWLLMVVKRVLEQYNESKWVHKFMKIIAEDREIFVERFNSELSYLSDELKDKIKKQVIQEVSKCPGIGEFSFNWCLDDQILTQKKTIAINIVLSHDQEVLTDDKLANQMINMKPDISVDLNYHINDNLEPPFANDEDELCYLMNRLTLI